MSRDRPPEIEYTLDRIADSLDRLDENLKRLGDYFIERILDAEAERRVEDQAAAASRRNLTRMDRPPTFTNAISGPATHTPRGVRQ